MVPSCRSFANDCAGCLQASSAIRHQVLSRHVVAMNALQDKWVSIDVESLNHGTIRHRLILNGKAKEGRAPDRPTTREGKAALAAEAAVQAAANVASKSMPKIGTTDSDAEADDSVLLGRFVVRVHCS